MAKRVLAYLDGGPANGMVVELDEPHWAPLGALTIEVAGRAYVYLRADQPRPPVGQPWRYVPETVVQHNVEYQAANDDPYDD
ncbi:MAG: hypothetical protein WAL50_19530 [Kineosporiaceae bacterium]|jgi:hypothetical protein